MFISFTTNDCTAVSLACLAQFNCFSLSASRLMPTEQVKSLERALSLPTSLCHSLSFLRTLKTEENSLMSFYSRDFKLNCLILRQRRHEKKIFLHFHRSCYVKLVRHSPVQRMRSRMKIANYKEEIELLNKAIDLAYTIKCSVLRHKYRTLDINRSNCDALFDQLADDLPIAISFA